MSEADREIEPWEIVAAEMHTRKHFFVTDHCLQRVQFLTEKRESARAKRSLAYPIDSITGYFDHVDERADYKLRATGPEPVGEKE